MFDAAMISANSRHGQLFKRGLLATASATALLSLLAQGAQAQDSATSGGIETVVVSASRLTASGFSAPTPTTVVGAADLEQKAEVNVQAALIQLPSMGGTSTNDRQNAGTSSGNLGVDFLNLRSLGVNRMLVLVDGQRIAGSNLAGTVDISQLPQALIQRVDVVTGGASASWGSDAVTGVVNFVLNKDFNGLKGNIQGGITTYGDEPESLMQLTAGTGFDGGRGHVEMSAEFSTDGGIKGAAVLNRPWYKATKLLGYGVNSTPAGSPQFISANGVYPSTIAPGGLITSGPLKGIAFGTGGKPFQFQYGSLEVDPFMIGGDNSADTSKEVDLAIALNRASFYGRVSYNLTSDTNFYVTALYSATQSRSDAENDLQKPANLTLQCTNAFLDPSVTAACATNKITSFQFGTNNQDMGPVIGVNHRDLNRITMGADGAFSLAGTEWTWDAYGEHATNDTKNVLLGETLGPRYNAAIQAVRNANGQIVCASAVAQASGCVPLDIFGTGVMSPQAISYVTGGGVNAYKITYQRQEAAAFNVNGQPFTLPAGPVAVASGIEYREEAFNQPYVDQYSNGSGGDPLLASIGSNWFQGGFYTGHGSYHVAEAFVEAGIPLIHNDAWGKADLDLSGREEHYSTAGWVSTWKVGLTYDTPLDGLRLRALQSRDVRAPGLAELFPPVVTQAQNTIDDFAPFGGQTFPVRIFQLGNAALAPEKSISTEIGFVYQPDWIPGFNASIDYWHIAIKGGISSFTNQQTMDLCFQGNQALCANIVNTAGASFSTATTGAPASYTLVPFNLSSTTASGFDLEASYGFAVDDLIRGIDGNLTFRALGTNYGSLVTNPGVPGQPVTHTVGTPAVGSIGAPTATWRVQGNQAYQTDGWGFNITERFTSQGVLNRQYIQCAIGSCPKPTINNPTINNNIVPALMYVDIGGQYLLTHTGDTTAYFKVDNVSNSGPQIVTSNSLFSAGYQGDLAGRFYHVGVRFQY